VFAFYYSRNETLYLVYSDESHTLTTFSNSQLVHDALDQINLVVDTCIGYAVVLGAEIFTEMEGMVKEVNHLRFLVQDV